MKGRAYLRYVAEHAGHSPGSSTGNLDSGGGGDPRMDPSMAAMKAMTIAVAIRSLPDRDVLEEWIHEEIGRTDAEFNVGDYPVYTEALKYQETAIEKIERNPRFVRGLRALDLEMKRREKKETAHLKKAGYDV